MKLIWRLSLANGFADDLYTGDARVQLIVDATDPNMSTSQVNYATGIVSMVGQEMIPRICRLPA